MSARQITIAVRRPSPGLEPSTLARAVAGSQHSTPLNYIRWFEIPQKRMGYEVVDTAKQLVMILCFHLVSIQIATFFLSSAAGIKGDQRALTKDWPVVPRVPFLIDAAPNGFSTAAQIIGLVLTGPCSRAPGRAPNSLRLQLMTNSNRNGVSYYTAP